MSIRTRRAVAAVVIAAVPALLVARLLAHGSSAATSQPGVSSSNPVKLVTRVLGHRLGAPVSGEAAAALGDQIWIAGGLDAAGGSADGIFRLDPKTGALAPAGLLPEPLHDAAAAPGAGGLLVFGGGSTASTSSVESVTAGGDAKVVGQLPGPRSDLVAATIGDRSYVLGGYDGRSPDSAVLETTDGRSFTAVAHLPVPVRYPAAAVAGGVIYLFGGETGAGQPTDAVQKIVPGSGSATVVGHLPSPLEHASAVALGGQIYVLGGTTGRATSDRVLSFDPATHATKGAGTLPMPVANAAAVAVGGAAYLIGGVGEADQPLSAVIKLTLEKVDAPGLSGPASTTTPASSTTTTTNNAPAAQSMKRPFDGHLLIADRGNNRLLLVNAQKRVLWRYPAPGRPAPPGGFYFPDDAFFTHGGSGIIANEEENERIVQLGFPSGKVTWSYGHPGVIGSTPGVPPRAR